MILVSIDNTSKQPLFKQIVRQIKSLIDSGTLQAGERLPSTRRLAQTLSINRNTVYRAYEELWAAGYIESTIGGYSSVRKRQPLLHRKEKDQATTFNWDSRFSGVIKSINETPSDTSSSTNKIIDFRQLGPDPKLMPVNDFRKCMNFTLQENGGKALQYGNRLGYEPLREFLARQLGQHGIAVSTNEVILTNGMQNGIELVARLLTHHGDLVFIENPSYGAAIKLFNLLGLRTIGIPMLSDGIDLKKLERKFQNQLPKFIYTIPTFHNPTGISTSQAHREKLLALCEQYEVPIVEDGFEEEMKYFGKAVLPIKSMDRKQQVIYLGTFSKVLFPGIRLGWIAASSHVIDKLGQIKMITDICGSPLIQIAMDRFCRQGLYELNKKRMHKAYRKRMQAALSACREFFPEDLVTINKPDGGYLIWIKTTIPISKEESITRFLITHGIALSPGSKFFNEIPDSVCFRLSIAYRNEDEIREGIKKTAELLKEYTDHENN